MQRAVRYIYVIMSTLFYLKYENIIRPVLDSMEAIVSQCEDILDLMVKHDCDVTSCYNTLQVFCTLVDFAK